MMPGLGSKVVARARPWARGAGAEGRAEGGDLRDIAAKSRWR